MSKISGMKEWSIDNDGVYVASDKAHVELGRAFEESEPVCVKIVDRKTKKGMFGGLAFITEYTLEAPYEEAMTYSITLEGNGALSDISDLSSGTQPTPGGGEA